MQVANQISTSKNTSTSIASSEKGKKRITEIMEACRSVLIDKGYTQFSLRNIAKEAGIHLSNLQYYFRTREDLLGELISYNANTYFEDYDRLYDSLPSTPYPRFVAVLDYLIEDIKNPLTRRYFIQLWALLDASDEHSGKLLNDMYAPQITHLNKHLKDLNPDLSPGLRQQRAAIITSMIDGMMLMLEDADSDNAKDEPGIEMEMRKQIIRIAMDH
jgi:TetR/AcrR family transcriptional regulator